MTIQWLPAAVRDPHGRSLSWAAGTPVWRGVLHTTEGRSWPTYGNWAILPHATILPTAGKGVTIRQHIPFTEASFSLVNAPGGAETNREWAFQFELIGTCVRGGPGYFWPGADTAVLADLYDKLIHPLSQAFGIHETALEFQPYPASYGARGRTNTVRMSAGDWERYRGWLGHQHVPENDHGDPGDYPWQRMMDAVAPIPAPPAPEDEMNWDDKITLTAADAKARGNRVAATATTPAIPYKAGDEVTISSMLRYTTGELENRAEMRAQFAATTAALKAMATSLATLGATSAAMATVLSKLTVGGTIDAAELEAAAKAGAEAALADVEIGFTTKPGT